MMRKFRAHFFNSPKKTCFSKKIAFKNLAKTFFLVFSVLFFSKNPVYCEKIVFHADAMNGKTGSKNEATTLFGNAYVKTETMEIKADSITLSGENFRYITASGTVDGKNTESGLDFTCGNMKYDRTTKIARLEDAVSMTDTANDVKADAQIIEYDQNTEIATMQINVSIKQKDNTCTAAFAIYRKGKQMLEMTGNPKIVQGEDSFRAQEITLNLETQEIRLDGRVSGKVSDTKKAENQKGNSLAETEKAQDTKSENGESQQTQKDSGISENENGVKKDSKSASEDKNE